MSSLLAFQQYWADDFTSLRAAGKAVLRELREDEADGDLHRQLVRGGSHLYFPTKETRHVRSLPLPLPVRNEIKKTRSVSLMGLLPQAKLAWTTVDHKLFIWGIDKEGADHRMELVIKSGQCIVSVGLAPPKREVFSSKVEWILLVSTFDEVLLCALARQDGQLRLVETRYALPTDSNPVITTCGLPNGRLLMGCKDGCLYEFCYDGMVDPALMPRKTPEQLLDDFYDGNATSAALKEPSLSSQVYATGKRAASQMWNGSERPQKCRKFNHSTSAMSRAIATVVPDMLRKIPSSIGSFLSGEQPPGAVIKIVHDPERAAIYALTERGIIDVFDLSQTMLQHKARLDSQRAAHKYLTLLSKGHMHVSGTSSNPIEFLGGGISARAGVGGIDGARSIVKSSAKSLTPVSIHVIPRRESSHFTLLAVTAGGLRLYLTTLGGSQTNRLAPSSRITLCHIRAPPPINPETGSATENYEEVENIPGGMLPRLMDQTVVDSVAYSDGHLFLALQPPKRRIDDGNGETGNLVLATNPDCMGRKINKQDDRELLELPGGISEGVSLPAESKLPGGRLVDSCFTECPESSLINLILKSRTPTDSELNVGLVPAYNPRISEKGRSKSTNRKHENGGNSRSLASQSDQMVFREGSIMWTVIANFLTSRPLTTNVLYRTHSGGSAHNYQQIYRLSNRYGCNGFSSTAGGKLSSGGPITRPSGTHQAARLSPWLLQTPPVPLKQLAVAHALPSREMVALSVGGLHFFKTSTILENLASTLMSAQTDVMRDKDVDRFFKSYGFKQGCALCLVIAMGCGTVVESSTQDFTDELKERSKRAALSRAYRPKLFVKSQTTQGHMVMEASNDDKAVPDGYDFRPSFLFDGLTSVLSRLLRPFWFKPAVVVTEGQTQAYGRSKQRLPAKVELLLDDETTLHGVRQPLVALQKFIQEVFVPAISVVPGVQTTETTSMDVDSNDNYITNGIVYQGSLRNEFPNSETLSPETRERIAHLIEERNIHSLYRLVSRTVQLLNLLELLKRAQFMPELPEVEWGLLHGLTVCQLVQEKGGHERVEALLNTLVSNHRARVKSTALPSADSDELTRQFAAQCYHYYSPGTNYAMLGFRAAREALNCEPRSGGYTTYADATVKNLKLAAAYWTNPQLVSGRLMHSDEAETIEQKALRAFYSDSPLAKAADVLMQLGKANAVVEICGITASNFGGQNKSPDVGPLEDFSVSNGAYPWEKSLYHTSGKETTKGSLASSSSGQTAAIVVGTNVTPKDAISSCHAILLFHLNHVLNSSNHEVAKSMLTACAAFPDKEFLATMFDFLLEKNMVDDLLNIDSADLERWLKLLPDFDLLRRFYIVHGRHSLAGNLMWEKAVEVSETVPLGRRVEFLSESLRCFKTAKFENERGQDIRDIDAKIRSAKDHLDLAKLQDTTLRDIVGRRLEDQLPEAKMKRLQMSLLEASEFYNEYTAGLNLFEGCLRILHHCRHNDPGRIEMLWKSVIFDEIFPVATRQESALKLLRKLRTEPFESETLSLVRPGETTSLPLFEMGEWLGTLKQKVEKLGRDLYGKGADYICPVEFLVVVLEELRHTLDIRAQPWPMEVLLNINVSYDKLLDAFEARIRQEERHLMGGADPLTRYLHLRSIVELIGHWVGSTSDRARKELRMSSVRLSNQMDAMKIALGEVFEVGDEVRTTYRRLEEAQGRLSYLL